MIITSPEQHTLDLLRTMLGTHADFRPGQWDAIEAVAIQKKRALVVQRTGWGKSLVYFLATKLLREQGAGQHFLSARCFRSCGIKSRWRNASVSAPILSPAQSRGMGTG